jgi:molybdopterin converting factor small subunit
MNIEVKVFYNLAEYLPPESLNQKNCISLEEGSNIKTILEKLGIPEQMTKVILVNGIKPTSNETPLKDGDLVAIFPPLAGG